MSSSRVGSMLAFSLTLAFANTFALVQSASTNGTGCSGGEALPSLNGRECCRSFIELHDTIIDCLPAGGASGGPPPCLAQCILQSYRGRPILDASMPVSMSHIITIGPKLATHFDQCKVDLFDFLASGNFEGDFRRVVCNERLNKFLECMVMSWLKDCIGFDSINPKCNELREKLKTTTCHVSTFFAVPRIV